MAGITASKERLSAISCQLSVFCLLIYNLQSATCNVTELFFKPDPVAPLLDLAAFQGLEHFLRHPVKLLQDDRLAAHAGHERKHERPLSALVQRTAHLCIKRPAAADTTEAHVRLDDADDLELAEHILDPFGWIWTDGSQAHHPDLGAALPHVANRVARGHRMTALNEEHDVGAVGHELFDPSVVATTEDLREFLVSLLDDRHGPFHGAS